MSVATGLGRRETPLPVPAYRRPARPVDDSGPTGEAQLVLRVLKAAVIVLIFLERVGLPFPGGYISPMLLTALGLSLVGYWRRWFVEDRLRTTAYLLGVAACLVSGLVSLTIGLPLASFKSLLLLVVIYAPFCLVLRPDLRVVYRPMLQFLSNCVMVIAVIAIVQILAQVAGVWTFQDYWLTYVPHALTVQGYQEPYPIYYGASLIKSDGLFALEPSFCSQLVALGIVVQLVLGERRWRIPVFALALLSTVSGTGLLLLGAGLAAQMVRRGPRWSARILAVAALSAGVAAMTAPGQAVLLRATEFHSKQSSGNGRFIAPYQRMWDQLGDGTQAVVIGTGPGSGDRQDNEIIAETNQPAIAPVIPKLVIEYGVIAAAVFIGALLVFICARCLSPTLAACMVMFHFVLSATLLDAQQVYLVWLLVSVFARPTNEAVPVLVRFPHRIRTTAASRVSGGVAAPAGGGAG